MTSKRRREADLKISAALPFVGAMLDRDQKLGRQELRPTGAQLATSPVDAWRVAGWVFTTIWLKIIAKTAIVRVMIVMRRATLAIV